MLIMSNNHGIKRKGKKMLAVINCHLHLWPLQKPKYSCNLQWLISSCGNSCCLLKVRAGNLFPNTDYIPKIHPLLFIQLIQHLRTYAILSSQERNCYLASVQCCSVLLPHFGTLGSWRTAGSILFLPRHTVQRNIRRYLFSLQSWKKKKERTHPVMLLKFLNTSLSHLLLPKCSSSL